MKEVRHWAIGMKDCIIRRRGYLRPRLVQKIEVINDNSIQDFRTKAENQGMPTQTNMVEGSVEMHTIEKHHKVKYAVTTYCGAVGTWRRTSTRSGGSTQAVLHSLPQVRSPIGGSYSDLGICNKYTITSIQRGII